MAIEREIETARLRGAASGSEAGASDRTFLRSLFADPLVAATLWPPPLGGPRSATQADGFFAGDAAHWARHGFGPWIFRVRESGAPVARGGLKRTTFGDDDAVEIVYAVASDAWGRGYATEIAAASLAVARADPRAGEVVALTLTTNLASQRVMEKIGLRFVRPVTHAGLAHVLYRADA
jgi:RimJ/RimL family protein N-acetyltransferase